MLRRDNTRASVCGFVLGTCALFLAQLLDAIGAGFPDVLSFPPVYLFAGLAGAAGSLPAFRARLTQQTDSSAMVRRSLFASTATFVPFLAATLLTAPEISARPLIFFYAFFILLDWLIARLLIRFAAPRPSRMAAYLDSAPHAPFVVAGLVLLALVPLALTTNQQAAAARIANWSYGFLALGVAIALLRFIPIPNRARSWKHLSQVAIGIMIVASFVAGYAFGKVGLTTAESIYIRDLNPNYLDERVTRDDFVISDSPQLDLGALPHIFPSLNLRPDQRGIALWDDLSRALEGKRRVFWVSVPQNSTDTQAILTTFLKANGCLDDVPNTTLPIRVYEMRTPLAPPRVLPPALVNRVANPFDSVQLDFGAIQITGVRFESRVCSHDAIAIAVRWQLDQPTQAPLKISLKIADARGRQIQTHDEFVQDAAQRSTDQWDPKSQVSGYYLVPIPFGTIPGDYALSVGVYSASTAQRLPIKNASGDSAMLGKVQVYRPDNLTADPYKTIQDSGLLPAHVELRDGLMLDAYGVSGLSVIPGTNLRVTARWRALQDDLPAYPVRIRLSQGEWVIAEASGAPVDGTFPTDKWLMNEPVLDHWNLRLPPNSPGGKARLEIGIEGGKMLYVADIDVATITRTFQIPTVMHTVEATFANIGTLVGYDLERAQVSPNDTVNLTMYWRAASSAIDKDYAVFAQLLAADGHLIAQSDGIPSHGERPTRSWLTGEIVQDPRALNFSDLNYRGDAMLIVGLYDPATAARVPITGSKDSAFELPTHINVGAR